KRVRMTRLIEALSSTMRIRPVDIPGSVCHGKCPKHNTRVTVSVLPVGRLVRYQRSQRLGCSDADGPPGVPKTLRCPVLRLIITNAEGALALSSSIRRTAISKLSAHSHQTMAPSASISKISNGGIVAHDPRQKSLPPLFLANVRVCGEHRALN